MEIIVNVESKFGVVFEPHDFQELHSFASFYKKVQEKLEK
jgi:acyl carrier protein